MTDNVERKLFHVSISFLTPNEATVPMAAESKEQAIEILSKMFAQRPNFTIHDIYETKDCPELQEMIDDTMTEDDTEPTKH